MGLPAPWWLVHAIINPPYSGRGNSRRRQSAATTTNSGGPAPESTGRYRLVHCIRTRRLLTPEWASEYLSPAHTWRIDGPFRTREEAQGVATIYPVQDLVDVYYVSQRLRFAPSRRDQLAEIALQLTHLKWVECCRPVLDVDQMTTIGAGGQVALTFWEPRLPPVPAKVSREVLLQRLRTLRLPKRRSRGGGRRW